MRLLFGEGIGRGKHITYLALGLSRRFRGKHWLLVIGVHTIPELDVPINWGRLK
jgi:hypothetical protein